MKTIISRKTDDRQSEDENIIYEAFPGIPLKVLSEEPESPDRELFELPRVFMSLKNLFD